MADDKKIIVDEDWKNKHRKKKKLQKKNANAGTIIMITNINFRRAISTL
jgi:hypothetical protein